MSEYQFYVWGDGSFDGAAAAFAGLDCAPLETAGRFLTFTPTAQPATVTVCDDADGEGTETSAANTIHLSEELTLDGKRYPIGTRIIADLVLTSRDIPTVTLIAGHLVDASLADGLSGAQVVFSSTRLAAGQHLRIADISDAAKRGQGQNCFARGTLIETPHGAIPVERLEDGDEVLTRNGGIQLIAWVGHRRLSGLELVLSPRLQPVRIMAGALTGGRPGQDLVVSQDHRLVVDDWRAAYLFGEEEILVPAKSLLNDRNVVVDCPLAGVEYFHLLMAADSLVCANGLWAETMLPNAQTLEMLSPVQRAEVIGAQAEAPSTAAPRERPVLPGLAHENAASIAA